MLDNKTIQKYKIMSEYDEEIAEIIRNFTQVEKSRIVCYTYARTDLS